MIPRLSTHMAEWRRYLDDTITDKTYNPGQDIWNKIDNSSKTGQGKKSLVYTFACFLTATAKL